MSNPHQSKEPQNPKMSEIEENFVDDSIQELLSTGAIQVSIEEKNQFVSSVFTVPKPDGNRRFILNLKKLNEFVEAPHFKLEDLRTACNLISKNCFMGLIDQKDAYNMIPIHNDSQKFLKFRWKGILYKYTCLPFGSSLGPWLYTKIMKPVMAYLRNKGILTVSYLDDCLVIGASFNSCQLNITEVVKLYAKLGLRVNYAKSELVPKQKIKFLGFLLDSISMRLELPKEKKLKIVQNSLEFLNSSKNSIERLAELIGILISACPAVQYGQLYTRQLEMEKIVALANSNQNFSTKIHITDEARQDIQWWIGNINNSYKCIKNDLFDLTLTTDASTTGWGAECKGIKTRGFWNSTEAMLHINVLELLAIFNGLKALVSKSSKRILCRTDNTTAIAYINRYGGCRSKEAHLIAKQIWQYCEKHKIVIFASYINTKDNFVADKLSREKLDKQDFMLNRKYFCEIRAKLGSPEIDLFATSKSKQCEKFVSWLPDPGCEWVDAFTKPWMSFFYAFPPFCLLTRVLQKIRNEGAEGIVVAPYWPTQPWFPLFNSLVISKVILLKPSDDLLICPYTNRQHQLSRQMTLMVAKLSPRLSRN